MTVTFTIPYPPTKAGKAQWAKDYGLNAYWTGKHWGRRRADAEYWHSLTHAQLRAQGVPRRLFAGPVAVTFSWDDGLDVDNHAAMGKMILDALKGWLIPDDSRRYVTEVRHRCHRGGVIRVEVTDAAAAEKGGAP